MKIGLEVFVLVMDVSKLNNNVIKIGKILKTHNLFYMLEVFKTFGSFYFSDQKQDL